MSVARLSIDAEFCLNLRGHELFCRSCALACPVDAFELSGEYIELDIDRCTACGACLPGCPAGALRMDGFSPRHFLERSAGVEPVHIQCSACHRNDAEVEVPCHRLLDARLLAAARAAGSRVFHLHGLTGCEGCPRGDAVAHIAEVQERLLEWFGAPEAPQLVATTPLHGMRAAHERPEAERRMNRRDWFRLVGARATEAAGSWLSPAVRGKRPAPSRVELERQRPAEYQAVFAERLADMPWGDVTPPGCARRIGDGCSACLACAKRCPTGALQAEENGSWRALTLASSLCTDCGLCDRLCPTGALQVQRIDGIGELVGPRKTLLRRKVVDCPGCGQGFHPQNEAVLLCTACADEEALLTGWLAQVVPDAERIGHSLPCLPGRRVVRSPGRERGGVR